MTSIENKGRGKKMKDKNLKAYLVSYASGMFNGNQYKRREDTVVYSTKELVQDQFVVVEHVECGIFIAKVLEDVTARYTRSTKEIAYKYVQDIDLSDYLQGIENAKKKEELKIKMQERFKVIDEEKKYQYYAELDEDLKAIYEEYKQL